MKKLVIYATDSGLNTNNGKRVDIDSVYSESFVDTINIKSDKTVWLSDYINEIFMYYYLRTKEYADAYQKNNGEILQVKDYRGVWAEYIAAARVVKLKINKCAEFFYHFSNVALLMLSFIIVVASSFILPLFIVTLRPRKKQFNSDAITVIHSPASYEKMKFLEEADEVKFYYDDMPQKKSSVASMYCHGTLEQRTFSLLLIPIMAIRDYFLICKDSMSLLGAGHTGFVLFYYSKRIAHKCVFEYFVNIIIKNNNQAVYYTGNKEDRFAVLEKRLCNKYGMKSVCIPHGIEYSFRVPAGLAGDVFYCTTPYAQKHLAKLYGCDDKFIYDKDIAKKMFSRGQPDTSIDGIVFFPESREPAINLSIIKELVKAGLSFSVKLHIKDNAENYKEYSDRFSYVNDFDFAISNKICLARKSTVLVEAIYNNSIPIAVLTNPKDRAYVEYMFPSLNDSQIKRVYTFEGLVKHLNELISNITSSNSYTYIQDVE